MANIDLPLQFSRLTKKPAITDTVFTSDVDLQAYLTSPVRYAGQIVSLVEGGKVSTFKLNAAEDDWEELSGGGDTYNTRYLQNFEEDSPLSYITASGGLTVSEETTFNIDGETSAKLYMSFASIGDSAETSPLDIDLPVYKKSRITFMFDYNVFFAPEDTYKIETIVNDGTDDRVVTTGYLTGDDVATFRSEFQLEKNDETVRFKITADAVDDSYILILDNFRIDIGPARVKEFTVTGGKRLRSGSRASAGTISNFSTDSSTGKFSQLFVVSSGVYTALVDSFVSASVSGAVQSGNSDVAIVYEGSYIGRDGQSVGGGYYSSTSAEFEIKTGESFSFDTVSVGDVSGIEANFTATATAEGTVYASDTSASDIIAEGTLDNYSGSESDIGITSADNDSLELINTTTNEATVPEKGLYTIGVNIGLPYGATNWADSGIKINGGGTKYFMTAVSNSVAASSGPRQMTLSLNKNDVITFRGGTSGATVTAPTFTITKAATNIDNFIVDVGTKHVSGGEEYPTGDTLDGKPIYARTWIVGTDVTVSDAGYITGLPTNITPTEAFEAYSGYWYIHSYKDATGQSIVNYDKGTGNISVSLTGSGYIVGAGTRIYLPYTKD